MSLLEADHLTVRRGDRTILQGVSLGFEPGEFVGLIGANGAGKSTLLGALAGLSRPEGGRVLLEGRPLHEIAGRTLARRRAFLPQNPRAEWPISVERLVALGLIPQLPPFGGLPAELEVKVSSAIAAFDLGDHREQPVTTLSGGELARAMLARALVGEPDLLIADEPIAGLDPRHAIDSVIRLRDLARAGMLVIAAMHDLTLVVRYATRVIVLHQGGAVGDGPAATTLTAALLRQAFDVDAEVSGSGERARVDFLPQGAD